MAIHYRNRSSMYCLMIAAALALAEPLPAFAEESHQFEVQAPDAVRAIHEFGVQSGVQILASAEQLKGKNLNEVTGTLSTDAAFRLLLEGTGLSHRYVGERTVALVQAEDQAQRRDLDAEAPRQGSDSEPLEVEEIVVTGSRLSSIDIADAIPVRTITRKDIERTGKTSVADVLALLPEASIALPETTSGGVGLTTVRLRGLPLGTTLVLLNGRRIGQSGAAASQGFFDLNLVPLAAVERIDVLSAGSSAVYGGDALAGIVNIVLRENFSKLDSSIMYGSASGLSETNAAIAKGWTLQNGSVSLVGSYMTRGTLTVGENNRTALGDYRPLGGPDNRSANSNPGNVSTVSGANLPGLTSPSAAVPRGSTGIGLVPQDFAATAGTVNRFWDTDSSLIPSSDRVGVLLAAHHSIGGSADLFAEALYSRVEQAYWLGAPEITANVPATHPFNPFDVPVRVGYVVDFPTQRLAETDFVRPLIGVRGHTFGDWRWELAGWMSSERSTLDSRALSSSAVSAALAATDPSATLNVFQDGPGASREVLESLFPHTQERYKSRLSSANGFMSGSLARLPAGDMKAVIGGEHSRETIHNQAATVLDASRDYTAWFGELVVPLVGRSRGRFAPDVALHAAVRYDRYSDFGSSTNPQFALSVKPLRSLLLRAAYSTAFRPPSLFNMYGSVTVRPQSTRDPQRSNELVSITFRTGANPGLGPESGETTSFGAVFTSEVLPGLRLEATHWDSNIEDGIGTPNLNTMLLNETLFPGRIVRGTPTAEDVAAGRPGRLLSVDATRVNSGGFHLSGVDFAGHWRLSTHWGTWTPSLSVTNTYRYDRAVLPGAPKINQVGIFAGAYAPRWKGTAGLDWQRGEFSASLRGRYTGSYVMTTDRPRSLGNDWFFDAQARWQPSEGSSASGGLLSHLALSIGATNLLNRRPDYSGDFYGMDFFQYSLLDRQAYVRVEFTL